MPPHSDAADQAACLHNPAGNTITEQDRAAIGRFAEHLTEEPPWYKQEILAYDLETTGKNPLTDRIVTASVYLLNPSAGTKRERHWLVNPGIEIPAEATEVHKVTTERAHTEGADAATAVAEIADMIATAWANGTPVCAYNAVYDLTMLNAEMVRHHGAGFEHVGHVIDPFVIDKKMDRFRKGSRKLADVAKHYGITLTEDDAHTADADALTAHRILWKIVHKWDEIASASPALLTEWQTRWFAQQSESFEGYLKKMKRRDGATEDEVNEVHVDRQWPIRYPQVIEQPDSDNEEEPCTQN